MRYRARAPLRLGLAGGGTDLSSYCDVHGGAVVNVAINRFAHAALDLHDKPYIEIKADDLGISKRYPVGLLPMDDELALHCATYNHMVTNYLSGRAFAAVINTYIDAQAGSGLGASSALTVALVEVFRHAFGLPFGRYDVAHKAYEIERIDLGLAGGKQDQYAAAFGGANFIEFLPNNKVIVNPLNLSIPIQRDLESSLMICYSGRSRDSQNVIKDQVNNMSANQANMHQLKADSLSMKTALLNGDILDAATVMARSWKAKKATSSRVSNDQIDLLLEIGLDNGALSGKVAGAGGGGYISFFVRPADRIRLWKALLTAGGEPDNITISHDGAEAWQTNI